MPQVRTCPRCGRPVVLCESGQLRRHRVRPARDATMCTASGLRPAEVIDQGPGWGLTVSAATANVEVPDA